MSAPAAAASSHAYDEENDKWGRVSEKEGVRFRVRGGLDTRPGHVGGPSPTADRSAMTWLDVVKGHLAHHPADRDAVWYVSLDALSVRVKDPALVGPKEDEDKMEFGIVGIHLPLGQLLSATVSPGGVIEIWIPTPTTLHVYPFEHHKVKYAMAALHCGMKWPAWEAGDNDAINYQVLGGWDDKAEGEGSTVAPPAEDNSIRNLVGLRRSNGMVAYANLHALRTSLFNRLHNQLPYENNPNRVDKIIEPHTQESLGSASYTFLRLSPAWFMYNVLGVVRDGFSQDSDDNKLIHSITYVLPIINVQSLVQVAENATPPDMFQEGTPELPAMPMHVEECVNCSFGRALAAVEIQYDLVAERPSNKRARDSDEYEAAIVVAEASLEDFLEGELGEDPRTYNADDAWEFFLASVAEDSMLSAADSDRLVAYITGVKDGRKKQRPATSGRAQLGWSHSSRPRRR